jgi:hypothetical protein
MSGCGKLARKNDELSKRVGDLRDELHQELAKTASKTDLEPVRKQPTPRPWK